MSRSRKVVEGDEDSHHEKAQRVTQPPKDKTKGKSKAKYFPSGRQSRRKLPEGAGLSRGGPSSKGEQSEAKPSKDSKSEHIDQLDADSDSEDRDDQENVGAGPVKKNTEDEAKKPRLQNDSFLKLKSLSAKHGYNTLHLGHLKRCLNPGDFELIYKRMSNAVAILNRARPLAEWATVAVIEDILHTGTGSDMLWHITHSTTSYWKNIDDLWPEFDWQKRRVNQIPNFNILVSKLGDEMDTAFSLQVVGKVELLKEQTVQVMGDVGKEGCEEIETWRNVLIAQNRGPPLLVFHRLNALLPKPYQWKMVPHTWYGDSFCHFSEEALYDLKAQDAINLPNIQIQMHIRNTHPNAHIIGIDLGVECMFAAVAYNPDDPAHLQTLAVRTKSMTEPERLFRSWLQLTKPERLVGIERQCTKSADDGWPVFMKAFVIAYDELHCHYGGKSYMKRSWNTAKAKQGEMDRALEGLVRMVGETMGNKLPDKKKVIVAIGLGEFETMNSRHIGFTRYLIRKLKPLGYTIVGVDEYYTSQKCPCCGGDVLAAENMVNILLSFLDTGQRPEYLLPPRRPMVKKSRGTQ
ncbi:hypothetical protein SeLEV6574_g07680 [Synchytrium endobioticum]|uniref:Cas12f1-like TNB domain-containing protein n=1 Tax=Synchytrium endobioticum TaxID=286115 RepID=A0A507CGW4_9FUNG|nr:hypothetical protein SeLEV6574_g07680 [Synchytrium endobioticum]